MGVGIGDQGKTIEGAAHPIHLGIGGEAGFERENFPAQVAETVFDPVETGLGSEEGKPGRPDVGRDDVGQRVCLQDHFKEIASVETKDRATVRGQISDLSQAGIEPLRGFEAGHEDQVVDFADLAPPFIDGADLRAEREADPVRAYAP
jgi:hypothetical protein